MSFVYFNTTLSASVGSTRDMYVDEEWHTAFNFIMTFVGHTNLCFFPVAVMSLVENERRFLALVRFFQVAFLNKRIL